MSSLSAIKWFLHCLHRCVLMNQRYWHRETLGRYGKRDLRSAAPGSPVSDGGRIGGRRTFDRC
jgi:hypothetical protein